MNLYIIPAWYPQDEVDLNASFFREQAHALADRGNDVTVIHIEPISVMQTGKRSFHEKRVWQDGNVRTIFHKVIIPIPGKLASAQDKYISELYYHILRDQIKEDLTNGLPCPNVMHAHVSHSCGYYCLEASKKLQIPLVVTEHYSGLLLGTASARDYQRVHDTIEGADAFIFVGTNFQKTLCKKLNIKRETFVVPNMVDNKLFIDYSAKPRDQRPFIFLTACNLNSNKSVDHVIRAFNRAFEQSEDVNLYIAGDGEAKGTLLALTKKLGEEQRIRFLGKYSREECPVIFCTSDAFVLTSQIETFGIVYVEAMMCGLPCIGTRGQGAEDIIDDNTGLLVDYGNLEQLAGAMLHIRNNYSSYNRTRIKSECIKRFSEDAVCKLIEYLYGRVCHIDRA